MENLTNIVFVNTIVDEKNGVVLTALCSDGSLWMKTCAGSLNSLANKQWTCINKGQNKN